MSKVETLIIRLAGISCADPSTINTSTVTYHAGLNNICTSCDFVRGRGPQHDPEKNHADDMIARHAGQVVRWRKDQASAPSDTDGCSMANGVATFTRGSQVVETMGLLFAAGLKPILWVVGIALSASIAWSVVTKLGGDDRYLATMHAYAVAWHWMEFGPDKVLQLHGPTTGDRGLSMADALRYGPMGEAWHRLRTLFKESAIRGGIIAFPACFLYLRLAQRLNDRAAQRKHKGGATLASRDKLLQLVRAYNRDAGDSERKETYNRLFGFGWELKAPLVSEADLIAEGVYVPYTIADIP